MSVLKGKGIWTLLSDIDGAVEVAPQVGAEFVLCKVSSRGLYSESLAGEALATVGQNPALKPVAWTFTYLENVDGEARLVAEALGDGFAAVVINAEAAINGKFAEAEQFAQKVGALGVDTSRVYIATDPRITAKIDEIPMVPLAKVCRGGFMPMVYGEIMPHDKPRAASEVTQSAYEEYARHQSELGYSDPLLPIITPYWDSRATDKMDFTEFKRWCDEAQSRRPTFVSIFRAGVTTDDAWGAFGQLAVSAEAPAAAPAGAAPVVVEPAAPEGEVIVAPENPGWTHGFFEGFPPGGWTEFTDANNHLVRYRVTSPEHTMWASYVPQLPGAARYLVEAFVPRVHATTESAQYFVSFHQDGERKEKLVKVNQSLYFDQWAPLGSYDLDPANAGDGRVNLIDLTDDPTVKEIAFSAIRWRVPPTGAGFDAPIGTEAERAGEKMWPGLWEDKNPYLNPYDLGFHTGADLNLNAPRWNSDAGAPVYAAADGTVTFSADLPTSSWQAVVVIRHAPLSDGTPVYSRYGHVDNRLVKTGDEVTRGQQIGQVGEYVNLRTGKRNFHLHFDISTTEILAAHPDHWPGGLAETKNNYVEPRKFILANRPRREV